MAYCKECGAYIPDGQEICLACGYDPNKKKTEKGKGGFAYEFDSAALKEELEKQRKAWESGRSGANRCVTPEDIAHAVAFLADGKSSFITGQVLTADGGFIL